jgi:hypothetical protein
MLIYDLSQGRVHDAYLKRCVQQSDRHVFQERLESAFFGYSATSLFQFMHLAQSRKGRRQICSDGTGGTCQDMSTLIVIGALSVKFWYATDNVTSSLRPLAYLHSGGERYHCYCLTLYVLRDLGWNIFGLKLQLDWSTSDHASTFVGGHMFFNRFPSICDANYNGNDGCTIDYSPPAVATGYKNQQQDIRIFPNETKSRHSAIGCDSATSLKRVLGFTRRLVPDSYVCKILIIVVVGLEH